MTGVDEAVLELSRAVTAHLESKKPLMETIHVGW